MSDKLKPCPFCGGEAHIQMHEFVGCANTYGVVCLGCGVETRQFYESKSETVKMWNTRTEPSWTSVLAELHERFDALEKEIRKASAEMSAVIREYVDRPKGEWIDMGDFEQCSACKGTHLKEVQTYYGKATWIKTNFCPNCGSDNREREGE